MKKGGVLDIDFKNSEISIEKQIYLKLSKVLENNFDINNYSFIDGQNLYLGLKDFGWRFDYRKFRIFFEEEYDVKIAYIFLGYLQNNQKLYSYLRNCGYVLVFKEISFTMDYIKGNVDLEMGLKIMTNYDIFDMAIIVTSDGDFACVVDNLFCRNKLKAVLSPSSLMCSWLLRKYAKGRIFYLGKLRRKLQK